MKALLLAALAFGQSVELLRRLPERELALERGSLLFGGAALVREGGKERVHYNTLIERGTGDHLEDAVAAGLITGDRDKNIHTESASRLLREAEWWVSRMAMLDLARQRAFELYGKEKSPELAGVLERIRIERLYSSARCRRLAASKELAGLLDCDS